jgi:holliday junction DNA helicase RuvA
MIGFLNGVLIEKTPDSVILDVAGVGYELTVPASSFCAMPKLGEPALLYVHTHVREDAIRLFGFASLFDRKVFESLIAVSNVGPKVAMSLLAPLDGVSLCEVIAESKLAILCNIPGVGSKTAERLLLELKPKLTKLLQTRDVYLAKTATEHVKKSEVNKDPGLFDGWNDEPADPQGFRAGAESKVNKAEAQIRQKMASRAQRSQTLEDLKSALLNIGYKDKQIFAALRDVQVATDQGALEAIDFEVEFRKILKSLSGHLVKETES